MSSAMTVKIENNGRVTPRMAWRAFTGSVLMLALLLLYGCGGGASTTANPNTAGPQAVTYTGPVASTSDVRAFQVNVWENLRGTNRCGSCHNGGQSPNFVRTDDVNLAYNEVLSKVDLTSPVDSRLVTKVGGGHNCWLSSNQACADILTAYISAWAGATGVSTGKQIQLKAPTLKDPGASKSFPVSSSLFASTVHPLLTAHCVNCHTSTSATPQAPYFAEANADVAYEAVRTSQKIDLDNPDKSRLVVRLRDEFHNCWSGNCTNDGQTMLNAIIAFANGVPLTQIDPTLVTSKALTLGDGIPAAGGNRNEANVIALYEFKTGQGTTAFDTSGVEPALNLTLSGQVNWVAGYGIEIVNGKAQGTTTASKKLSDLIKLTGEYSIEAWVVPGNVTQAGPARIISYSGGTNVRNFTLGQTLYNYNFLHRSSTTDANGQAALNTADADEDLQATQQHVVITFDPVNGRRIYVNGQFTGDTDPVAPGNLSVWDDTFALVLGNEISNDRLWKGKIRLLAIHNRALTAAQIQQNFAVGVGEKFYLLFEVGSKIGIPGSYIMFEVSQFDNYSYLFNKPTFINLNSGASIGSVPIKGLRIGINGKEAKVGQTYRNLDVTVTSASYTSSGQVLSNLGTVIASEKGAASDEFFLTFETLGTNINVVTEPAPLTPATPPDAAPVSDIGLRTFAEINASMAALTNLSPFDATDSYYNQVYMASLRTTYGTIKQQLPTVENISGFLSAHQIAISQLAIEYCNALVEKDSGLPVNDSGRYFSGLDYTGSVSGQLGAATTGRTTLLTTLTSKMLGTGLSTQPSTANVQTELDNLVTRLTACAATNSCATDRVKTVVKATCAATLGSAAMLVQ